MTWRRRGAICAALGGVVAAGVSCGSVTVGEREPVDEETINAVLQDVGFTVPSGFEFGQGYQYSEFVGEPARAARFDGPPELRDGLAVATANPVYPAMQPVDCEAEPPMTSWSRLGYICAPGTVTTQYPPGGALDTVTVVVTGDKRSAHLFVYSSGH